MEKKPTKNNNKKEGGDTLSAPTQNCPRVLLSRHIITRFTIQKHRVDLLSSSAAAAAVVAAAVVSFLHVKL